MSGTESELSKGKCRSTKKKNCISALCCKNTFKMDVVQAPEGATWKEKSSFCGTDVKLPVICFTLGLFFGPQMQH